MTDKQLEALLAAILLTNYQMSTEDDIRQSVTTARQITKEVEKQRSAKEK